MGNHAAARQAFAVGEFRPVRRPTTAAFYESEFPKSGFYGRGATPEKVGDSLRRKVLRDVFLVEKTLVEILRKFGNFNGINEIRVGENWEAFSQNGPTSF